VDYSENRLRIDSIQHKTGHFADVHPSHFLGFETEETNPTQLNQKTNKKPSKLTQNHTKYKLNLNIIHTQKHKK